MGKVISDEDIKLSIIINGNEAQKQLFDLEKSTRKLTEENKGLLLQKKLLEKQGKQDTEQYKLLTKTIRDNSAEIRENKTRMTDLQKQIGLTGLTMKQLTDRASVLRLQLRNMIPGSEAHRRFTAELGQINNRLSELNTRALTVRQTIGNLADGFNRYAAMGASILAVLTGVVLSFQKIIDINGKLSDAQADVMKTTGMTKDEVDELTKSFGLLETRTGRIDLLKIAESGGRIGILKEDMQDFVKVMNVASVALGDSFSGGPEEVADKLGKLKFLFQETKDMHVEQAYMSIGSAINGLGAEGAATEAGIADFATRMGSLVDVLKPTIAETLALGAAFEESGIESEVSARAYNIFMKQASTEAGKFAKVMNLTQKEVENMINKNPLDFMLQFAKGMRGMDATQTAKTLEFLGINADGANKVIGAMGNNFDRFNFLIKDSNKLFSEGTSLINEYDVKNNNLAATLEKLKKTVTGWFSSEGLNEFLIAGVSWLAKFVGATEDADGSVGKWRNTLIFLAKILAVVTAALVTNVGWQKLVVYWTTRSTQGSILYSAAEKARAFATGLTTIATQAQALAVALATRNTIAAKEATLALGLAMKTTPWGFVLSALAAVIVAYQMFSDKVTIASAIQKTMADVEAETAKSIAKQKTEMELLTRVAQDNNAAHEDRVAAIKKLNEIIPDHIGILTLENIKNQEGMDILKAYTAEIYKNARARAVQANYDKLVEQKVQAENKSLGQYQSGTSKFLNGNRAEKYRNDDDLKKYAFEFTKTLTNKEGKLLKPGTKEFYSFYDLTYKNLKAEMQTYLDAKNEEIAVLDAQIKALEPEIVKNTVAEAKKTNEDPAKSNFTVPPGKEDKEKKEKKYDSSYIDQELRLQEELFKLRKKTEQDRIDQMVDGYDKMMAIEKLNHESKIMEFNLQNKAILNLEAKLAKDLIRAEKDGDLKKITSIKNQQKILLEQKKELCTQEEHEERLHQLRIGTIQEKAATENIKKAKSDFDEQKILRAIKYNEELAALGANEVAKAALKRKYEAEELAAEEKFLKELLDKFNVIVGKGHLANFDLSLLTPEQVAEFTAEAAKVGLTLAELIAKKNELSGNEKKAAAAKLGIGDAGEKDVFGFTINQWTAFYENLKAGVFGINEMTVAVQALAAMWGQYNQYLEANENAQLKKFEKNTDTKKKRYKQMLDAGIINQATYTKQVDKLDKEVERQKAELEYKQAKRKKTMSIVETVINTATAIMQAYSQLGPIGGTIAAVLLTALGAAQVATISKQPLPARGYEEGLYPEYVKREQDGKVFKSRYRGKTKSGMVNEPSHFLVAENGPEMVIDNKAWSKLNPNLQQMLINELRGIKGFEKGYYKEGVLNTGNTPTSGTPAPNSDSDKDKMFEMAMHVMSECIEVLKDLRDNPIIAVVKSNDYRSMKELQDGIEKYNDLIKKTKK